MNDVVWHAYQSSQGCSEQMNGDHQPCWSRQLSPCCDVVLSIEVVVSTADYPPWYAEYFVDEGSTRHAHMQACDPQHSGIQALNL